MTFKQRRGRSSNDPALGSSLRALILAKRIHWYRGYCATSWRVDETYIKVGDKWKYRFRAVDNYGRLIDFMLADRRNTTAAHRFLKKALKCHAPLAAIVGHH